MDIVVISDKTSVSHFEHFEYRSVGEVVIPRCGESIVHPKTGEKLKVMDVSHQIKTHKPYNIHRPDGLIITAKIII